ncbi:hypothetical protein C8R45DRAFT_1177104 [Mycena sanguinolenta]|nr:hypothetical protein C8R45DRAFT_1177104 [Mycena sanguinolenta]
MFSPFYPRNSAYAPSYYSSPYANTSPYANPYGYPQQSPYARALAQQRARELAQQQERERLARARYLPTRGGYPYDYPSDDDDEDNYYAGNNSDYGYLDPLLEAKRRQALEQQQLQRRRAQLQEEAMRQQAVSPPLAPLPVEHDPDSSAQAQAASPVQRQNSPRRHSPSPAPRSPSANARTPSPAAAPIQPPPTSVKPEPTPEQLESAALTLQSAFRAHLAHRAISALSSQFDALRAGFAPPAVIDYQTPAGVVSVPVPASFTSSFASTSTTADAGVADEAAPAKLAYTPTNVPLHTHTEFLARLLVSLDAVESRGNAAVRARRRGVVRGIEAEASRLEGFWRGVWPRHVRSSKQEGGEKVEEEEEEEMREGEEGEEGEEQEEQDVHTMVVDADEPALPFPDAPALLYANESESHEEEETEEEEFEFHTPPASPVMEIVAPAGDEKEMVDEFVLV